MELILIIVVLVLLGDACCIVRVGYSANAQIGSIFFSA
jgi:hypothetical protein